LKRFPFDKNSKTADVLDTESFQECFARLEYIKRRGGIMLPTGDPGVGKILALRRCVEDLNGPRAMQPAPRPHEDADAPLATIRWCSGPSADRRFALAALALRLYQTIARSRHDFASFGRTGSRADAQSAPRPHENADAPLSCAVVARLPPVTSIVGNRRPRAIIFASVAVTHPPLRSGRDTSPWFAPAPSKPLRGFQGAGRPLPSVETAGRALRKTKVKIRNPR